MRKIFILFDGTGLTIESNTNIGKLQRLAISGNYERQHFNGPGATSNTQWRDKLFAPNLESDAIMAFNVVSQMDLLYDDQIFVFGYSRGAITARIFAMCIACKKSLKTTARSQDISGLIKASIELLCLFDPVLGRPRFNQPRVDSKNVVFEPRIKNYVELIACDEKRPHFSSENYFATSGKKSKVHGSTSSAIASSTKDRIAIQRDLSLLKTRKCIWFPGKHSDVGGHGSSRQIGLHSLATAVEELLKVAEISDAPLQFPPEMVQELILNGISDIDSSIPVGRNFLSRLIGMLGRRLPENDSLIQHFAHPYCAYSENAKLVTSELPKYPDYQRVTK